MSNSAIAAQYLSKRRVQITTLNVDVHHGNGTQGILYERNDIFTISLYADPMRFYPFFWGQANECSHGRGYDFNLNLPLARKTGDEDYLSTLRIALDHIRSFGGDIIVVATGVDARISDPVKGLSITTGGFGKIANNIAKLGKPIANVLAVGYLGP